MGRFWRVMLVLLALLCGQVAWADSCPPPRKETYFSADRKVRLVAEPCKRARGDLETCIEIAGVKSDPTGMLQRKSTSGKWATIWSRPLKNYVAPGSALVSNSGQFVVTFDDYCSSGFGSNVVVIYDAAGSPVRSFALSDILPGDYLRSFSRSFSHANWAGEHRFSDDGGKLLLQVVVPLNPFENEYAFLNNDGHVGIQIDLMTGTVTPPAGPDWDKAMAAVAKISARRTQKETELRRFYTEPLLGPTDISVYPLRAYVKEAFERLNADKPHAFTITNILRLPGDEGYDVERTWITGMPNMDSQNISIASLSSDHLIDVLRTEVGSLKPDQLRNHNFYIMATNAIWPQIEEIFAQSGAKLVQLDPEKPIPQPPERLAELKRLHIYPPEDNAAQ